MNDIHDKYEELLSMAEDYLNGGWRRPEKVETPAKRSTPNPAMKGERATAASSHGGVVDVYGRDTMEKIAEEIRACRKCSLGMERKNPVPGEGSLRPKVMIIGEAPGAQEDATGKPFIGRAGQYLDKWLEAIGLDRERDVFIGNVIKCRPPGNRDPLPDESVACMPYLKRQLALIEPLAILTLGRISTHLLTGTIEGIGKLHGRIFEFQGIPLIPTYHPSGVLRNPVYRKPVWDDLRKLKQILEKQEG